MTRPNNTNDKPIFAGFRSPNYTMVPDEVFDELLPDLSGAELKVLLYITRRTFGFKRDADSISLSQMLHGIIRRDERVLDRGVGISKPTLLQALRSLQDKNIIETQRQRSPDKGDEPTVYSLNFANRMGGQKTLLPVVNKLNHGGGKETSPGPWSKNLTTQYTVVQNTEKQQTNDDDTASLLESFGVSKSQTKKLITSYPSELIMEKLDLVQYLQSTGSPLVARNPQGWLIRAIDENYLPTKPKGYKSKADREQDEEEKRREEEEVQRAQEARTRAIQAFRENQLEKPIPGSSLTTKTAWGQALTILENEVNRANFQMWVKNLVLIEVEDDEILIGAPSAFILDWVQTRMRSRIANALSNVIGRQVAVAFEVVPAMTRDNID